MTIRFKFFLVLAFVPMVFFPSCRKSEQTNPDFSEEIRFSVSGVRHETRAFTQVTETVLQDNGFRVVAVTDKDNSLMFDRAVAYSNGEYTVPGEHYYYPKDGTVSFYAVYPRSESVSVDASGKAALSFSRNPDTDLVAAKAQRVSERSASVPLEFRRLLSQVTVKVQGENPDYDYRLKRFGIFSAKDGVYSFSDESWTPGQSTVEEVFFASEDGMGFSAGERTGVGNPVTFIPGTSRLSVEWESYEKGTSTVVGVNHADVDVALTCGVHSTFNVTLPATQNEIRFSVSLDDWQDSEIDVTPEDGQVPLPGNFDISIDNGDQESQDIRAEDVS